MICACLVFSRVRGAALIGSIEAGGTEVEVGRLLAGLVEGGRQTSGAYKKTWR